MALIVSSRLDAVPRYEPGLTTAEVLSRFGLESAIKLASNESPYPPLPEVEAVVRDAIGGLSRYPDGAGRALRRALAEHHGVGPEQVILGNGSCELLLLAGEALLDPGTSIVRAEPSFALYPHLAAVSGADDVAVPLADDGGHDLETMAAHIDERTRLVVVCNPNNPTGVYRNPDEIEVFLNRIPADVAVLVDEAYFDFVDRPDAGRTMAVARERENLLVTRTFSKAHGLCGLRVGYGVGGSGWVEALDKVRQPFNTNALAQAAALESLRHPAELARRVAESLSERARVERALRDLGAQVLPSQGNFLLMAAAAGVHEALLRKGIIVRDGAALGCPGRLRVTIGTPDENSAFLAALAEIEEWAPVSA